MPQLPSELKQSQSSRKGHDGMRNSLQLLTVFREWRPGSGYIYYYLGLVTEGGLLPTSIYIA